MAYNGRGGEVGKLALWLWPHIHESFQNDMIEYYLQIKEFFWECTINFVFISMS